MNHKMVKSITIHGLDDVLNDLLREKAERDGTSLNKIIKALLRQSLGISKQQKKNNFSEFSGIWTQEEFEEVEHSVKDFEKIDKQDWK